jgi:hypothetical protein
MYTEPEQNVFNFTGGDYLLDLAERYGMRVRCHNLVWVSQLSPWVTDVNWTAEALTAVMKNHIQTLITHWSDRCYSWDVVNEALASDGNFSSSIVRTPHLKLSNLELTSRLQVVRHNRARIFLPRVPIRPRSRRADWKRHQALLQRLRAREPRCQDNSCLQPRQRIAIPQNQNRRSRPRITLRSRRNTISCPTSRRQTRLPRTRHRRRYY